ncbi:hypothetical protein LX73_0182 [Fodinibius salinus]|uniref:Uncharacterized protein n=1 Tax=Fodinibius salinus TaxID=860790 RepID=A0A5D3YPD0_9BACT|nr:hypothetical protein [Fodinibius salinus]TYP94889.1 hypothetical protein LX73_0182 [Fodinibius salinus]
MSEENDENNILNRLRQAKQSFHKATYGEVEEHKVGSPKYFAALHGVLLGISDQKLVEALSKFGDHIRTMGEGEYNPEQGMQLIRCYAELNDELEIMLVPEVQKRFRNILKKDVEFIRMKDSDNGDLNEIADRTRMASEKQKPMLGSLDEQEQLVNYYLSKLLDYRLSTLPEEAAWDFVAQSILDHSTTKP